MYDEAHVKKLLLEKDRIIEKLQERINQLEKILNLYENPHVPPSKKRFPAKRPRSNGKPGQKNGHEGITRPVASPDKTVAVVADKCPGCGHCLNDPFRVESRTIEDLPEPRQAVVTEFLIAHYRCPNCGSEIVPEHPDLPKEGRFGKNMISQVTMMKFGDRMPHRKIRKALKRIYGTDLSAATILDLTRRACSVIRPEYELVMERLRNADVVYVDETGIKVNGKNYWAWVFTTGRDVIIVIDSSRGKGVIEQTLGEDFSGIIVCDGWKSYPSFTNKLQRCWAHLLREADSIAEKHSDGIMISYELHNMFNECMNMLDPDPPPDTRERIKEAMEARMRILLAREYEPKAVKGFIGKISNGMDHWFTFVVNPGVEPTNNIAERALREHVVQRKIIGTLRNSKGTRIHETAMSMIATWENMGLNPYEQLVGML